jgi:hypothetical protein
MLTRLAGQHDDGRLRLDRQQLPQPVQPLRVRQPQVEQDAGCSGHQFPGVGQGPRTPHDDRGADLAQQLTDQQGIAVVVLDQQHLHLLAAGSSDRSLAFSVTYHQDLHRLGQACMTGGLC